MTVCQSRKGFTLIELLLAISIVAIVSSIGFVSYSQAQVTARDGRRKQDLRAIAQALELYRQANSNLYPATGGACCTANAKLSSGSNPWITQMTTDYINVMPKDPKSDSGNPLSSGVTGYSYWSGVVSPAAPSNGCPNDPTGGQYYILAAGLENGSDPEAHAAKQYKDCNGNLIGSNNKAFIITSQ